jgi:hypothetical protein
MNPTDLDLNIDHYDIADLETFFHLTSPYTQNDVQQKEHEIRTLLLSSGHIAKHFQRDLILFLEEGKTQLLTQLVQEKAHTTIPPTYPPPVPHTYPVPPARIPAREQDVIMRPRTEFQYQQSSEFFEGKLNPINTRILKQALSIDTRLYDQSKSNTEYILSLPNKISKVVSLECISFEITSQSLFNISASLGNHRIFMTIHTSKPTTYGTVDPSLRPPILPTPNDGQPTLLKDPPPTSQQPVLQENIILPVETNKKAYVHTYIVADGNYTIDTLLETLNAISKTVDDTPFVLLEWKQDPLDSKKTIVALNENEFRQYEETIESVTMSLYETNVDVKQSFTSLGYLLGFTNNVYQAQTNYMSNIPANVHAALPYFYLSIEDYQNRSIVSFPPAFSQMSMASSQLARISLNHQTNEVKMVSIPRKYFGPIDVNRLQIRLMDPYGKNVNIHTNFSFCLLFDSLYDL